MENNTNELRYSTVKNEILSNKLEEFRTLLIEAKVLISGNQNTVGLIDTLSPIDSISFTPKIIEFHKKYDNLLFPLHEPEEDIF